MVREIYQRIVERPEAVVLHAGVPGSAGGGDPSETIRRMYSESPDPLKRFFDLLAARPDDWVSTDEVLEATALEPRKWPQLLSALARRWKSRYGGRQDRWPYRTERSYQSGRQTWRYLMPREYATVITSIQGDVERG